LLFNTNPEKFQLYHGGMPLGKQELLPLPEHLGSTLVLSGSRVIRSLA